MFFIVNFPKLRFRFLEGASKPMRNVKFLVKSEAVRISKQYPIKLFLSSINHSLLSIKLSLLWICHSLLSIKLFFCRLNSSLYWVILPFCCPIGLCFTYCRSFQFISNWVPQAAGKEGHRRYHPKLRQKVYTFISCHMLFLIRFLIKRIKVISDIKLQFWPQANGHLV